MAEVLEGQCQCGAVTYRVTGESVALFACHCSECQRQSSSAFGMALWIKDPVVELISGTLSVWLRSMPSGRQMVCRFCPVCGCRIFHQTAGQDQVISIKPGTLSDTKWLVPVGHIWCKSAQPWMEFPQGCLVYPENPEDFEAIFKAWKAKGSDNLLHATRTDARA